MAPIAMTFLRQATRLDFYAAWALCALNTRDLQPSFAWLNGNSKLAAFHDEDDDRTEPGFKRNLAFNAEREFAMMKGCIREKG